MKGSKTITERKYLLKIALELFLIVIGRKKDFSREWLENLLIVKINSYLSVRNKTTN